EYNQFDMERFGDEVMESDELKQSFKDYKAQYERDFDVDLADNFTLNELAFRKGQRFFRSVMKLDKNFTIYIHGARNRVEQGEDAETGMKYYKFLYENEN
ncbi:MAG: nucleoid-associated protein, partial [Bacteroidales bacterium]|nr:nucleoid-associated protein [Bacteroidales bacterium]